MALKLTSFRWEAPEYEHTIRASDWYWIVWIVAISIAVAAVFLNDIVFGVLIVFTTLALTLGSLHAPSMVDYEVDSHGVRVGGVLYPFSSLESFGVDLHTISSEKLILKSKKKFMPYIMVPLENADIAGVQEYLRSYLPEEDHGEPVMHKVFDYLGF